MVRPNLWRQYFKISSSLDKINMQKSLLFFSNHITLLEVARLLGKVSIPGTLLGIYMGVSRLYSTPAALTYHFILEKTHKKLVSWKGNVYP